MIPEEAVQEAESEDVSDEYEPDPYEDGYELTRHERAIADMES